jgi:CO/xanthine dehydrogenase Mo-binding subunit
VWKRVAALILSIEESHVHVAFKQPGEAKGEEERIREDTTLASSGVRISIVTNLIERACNAIREARFRESLPIVVNRFYRPLRKTNWEGKIWDQHSFALPSAACAIVEISLDQVLWKPVINHIWLSVYAGNVYSEKDARRSLLLSILASLGWTYTEKLRYEEGEIKTLARDYMLPRPSNEPAIDISFIPQPQIEGQEETNHPVLPVKELPFNTIPAAFLNALSQAACHQFESLPLSSLELWNVAPHGT